MNACICYLFSLNDTHRKLQDLPYRVYETSLPSLLCVRNSAPTAYTRYPNNFSYLVFKYQENTTSDNVHYLNLFTTVNTTFKEPSKHKTQKHIKFECTVTASISISCTLCRTLSFLKLTTHYPAHRQLRSQQSQYQYYENYFCSVLFSSKTK